MRHLSLTCENCGDFHRGVEQGADWRLIEEGQR